MFNSGGNAVGAMVGSGWYRLSLAWENNKDVYGKTLGLLVQLDITHSNGSKESVDLDDMEVFNWPHYKCEIYHGERYDARLEKTGWATPLMMTRNGAGLRCPHQHMIIWWQQKNEPITKQGTFTATKVITTPSGEKVLDFGQNLVGWVVVKATGKAGDSIVIKHAEVLDKNGNFYTDNLRAAKATAIIS